MGWSSRLKLSPRAVAGLAAALSAACSSTGGAPGAEPVGVAAAGASGARAADAAGASVTAAGASGASATDAAGASRASAADAAGASPAPAPLPGASAEPGLRLVGRFDGSDPAGPRFAWSGSGIIARFSGTSAGVRLTGNQQYTVLVDGLLLPKLVSTGELDPLVSDLPAAEHVIELYRRTEANQGEAQLLGFDFGAGELLAPPAAPERRIEIIGDSISCGYGNEGADQSCGFTPDTENHYLTYGAIAARNLGADLVTVAWSGKGVVCNYGDEAQSCTDPMPTYFDRALPDRADSRWDFAEYQPQAVVINLGTNDFSTAVDPSQAEFEAAYVSLLERVRAAYPGAAIFCTVGPLLGGADLATARASIAGAVATRSAAGDTGVEVFELAETNPNDGYGCDYHPSPRTHEIMAEAVTSVLRARLGW